MRKRIRKKLGVKEFVKKGFRVMVHFKTDKNPEKINKLIDAFLAFTIEVHQLSCGGCSDQEQFELFLTPLKSGSAREKHRHIIGKWLKDREEISSFSVGPLEKARQMS